ncbi:RNA helicase [Desulfuribacillus stibiiarsenatis]|uniref:RNA helicase n=1 Tax=Desulfuribacillus stibiiarsenatis TaxID=1390249 RepID=A0A1E5L8E6_9FIRM|nr:DEAD/DEAH box helicase [Desulfuribacillus stibiiarsenatis]OEH86420.1 RNA helicase [Desulfuribacillus stibiiarsenatis]
MENQTVESNNNWLETLQVKPFLQEAWKVSGFSAPTAIQEKSVPPILKGQDVIAESPTGTGKTLAYLIPILHKIDPEKKSIQAVVIAPSHELAMQIYQTVQKWTTGTTIVPTSLIGGANINKQIDNLKKAPHIIVGTTGRILELIKIKKLKMHEVKSIVVDEFDVLVAQEHIGNLNHIVKATLKDRQIVLFSATLSKQTEQIGKDLMNQPQLIQVKREDIAPSNTEHIYFICEQREKIDALLKVMRAEKMKALVFINDFEKLSELESKLKFKGISFGTLTGNSSSSERKKVINDLRDNKIAFVVTSDVAARGLDIEGLTHVINFDLPRDGNQYLHRTGRTGRMGASGTVYTLVTKSEESILARYAKKVTNSLQEKKLYGGKITEKRGR